MKDRPIAAGQINAYAVRRYRTERQESQGYFWSRFGVTQSRGSRFEIGDTEIPAPVAILLRLYFDGVVSDRDLLRGPEVSR
jgi:hypothetical protein